MMAVLCYNIFMLNFRRTRIVATIGPASGSVANLTRLINAGLNIARLNFSHGEYDTHTSYFNNLRTASRKAGQLVGVMQDLQGPKIRVGKIKPMILNEGENIALSGRTFKEGILPIDYPGIAKDVQKGHRILINDGLVELLVTGKTGAIIKAKVTQGGEISSHKGINLPDTHLNTTAFTEKDHEDLLFGLKLGVDYVALSFVESPDLVRHVRKIILANAKKHKNLPPKIIVKIERPQAVDRFLEILPLVDGVMIARGDLGIEIPLEEVPIVQKEFAEMCRIAGKPCIVATHMLDSMVHASRPTRAEVSDVANAVIDHADAVMLSAETATGDHPYTVVQTMAKVIVETERSYLDTALPELRYIEDEYSIIAEALYRLAAARIISGIVIDGTHENLVHKAGVYRPDVPLYIACASEGQARQSLMAAGATPLIIPDLGQASFVLKTTQALKKKRYLDKGKRLAFVAEGSNGKITLEIH